LGLCREVEAMVTVPLSRRLTACPISTFCAQSVTDLSSVDGLDRGIDVMLARSSFRSASTSPRPRFRPTSVHRSCCSCQRRPGSEDRNLSRKPFVMEHR
jgi:hypothetical protein